jgi:hypothetical protein
MGLPQHGSVVEGQGLSLRGARIAVGPVGEGGSSAKTHRSMVLYPLLSSWDRGEKNLAVATDDVPKQPAGLSTPLKGIGSKLVA